VREDIQKYLGTVAQSTAKTISHRLGLPMQDVCRELNGMAKDGTLEREMKKGEYAYWLTRGDMKAVSPADVKSDVAPSAPIAGPEVFNPPEFREVDESMAVLCALLDIDLETTEAPLKAAIDRVQLRDEANARLAEANAHLHETIAKLRANNAELERKIDELTIVDAEFVPSQVFVTMGRTAAPKRHRTLEKAQRRAHLLVRSEKESEVLVLEPVGRVVRGAEWRSQ
jgi:hypothetical protein